MPLATLTCRSCSMEPVSVPYDDGDEPLKTGALATVVAQHKVEHPRHRLSVTSEPYEDAAKRHEEERKAEHARAVEGAKLARKTMLGAAARWKRRHMHDRRN